MSASIIDTIPIIDADTHVIEPADLFTARVSVAKWGDLVPHVRWDDETQEELWYFGDKKIYAAGLASGARLARVPARSPEAHHRLRRAQLRPRAPARAHGRVRHRARRCSTRTSACSR